MPLPILLIPLGLKGAAAVAGAAGIGFAGHGAKKMKDASNTLKNAQSRYESNMVRFNKENLVTIEKMDKLGKLELEILHGFKEFSDVFEQIKNRPSFEIYSNNGVTLPKYDGEKIKKVSVGAGILLGGIGGAGLGAAGGFAAAGATTAAVMALGTASTGTAIASLSGAAATNATLALLGGGAIATGGGGMAVGAAALGAATLGVGLFVGGIIFNFTGVNLSKKANKACKQVRKVTETVNTICDYFSDLRSTADKYYKILSKVNEIYERNFNELKNIVTVSGYTDWKNFNDEQKKLTENTVLLVGLLYNMCKVELVLKSKKENDINIINKTDIEKLTRNANNILEDRFQL